MPTRQFSCSRLPWASVAHALPSAGTATSKARGAEHGRSPSMEMPQQPFPTRPPGCEDCRRRLPPSGASEPPAGSPEAGAGPEPRAPAHPVIRKTRAGLRG